MILQISAGAQDMWHSQVNINPTPFDRNESMQPIDTVARFESHTATSNRAGDLTGVEIGVDERMIEPDLAAVSEQRTLAPLAMMGIVVPLPDRSSHAASITVGQLAVPSKAHKAFQKALQAVRKDRRDEARAEVATALAIWPAYADALVLSALLHLGDRQPDDAIAAAEAAVRCDGTNGMAHVVLAAAYNSEGAYDSALSVLERGLRFRPDAWQGYVERSRAEIGQGKFTAGLADANRASELAPAKTSVTHFLRGVALLNLNRTSDGVLELRAYLRISPRGDAADKARLIIERSRTTP